MSRRQGARTGLKKPRATEAQLREAKWRASGAAVNRSDPRKVVLKLNADHRVVAELHGKEPIEGDEVVEMKNETMETFALLMETTDDPVFGIALQRMYEMGLNVPDYRKRIEAMPTMAEHAIALAVKCEMKHQRSGRRAMEAVAERYGIPAGSLDSARQEVARIIRKVEADMMSDAEAEEVAREMGPAFEALWDAVKQKR